MAKRVFVTGGSGFVGAAVVDELLLRQYTVNALAHRGGANPRATEIRGDLFDRAALDRGIEGCDAVVHLVGIIMEKPSKGVTFERVHFEGTRGVVDATRRAGVKRYVHMSALGVRPNAVSMYQQTKHRAEAYVREAPDLDWTILRPSMIHGPRGEFTRMQAAWARKQSMPFLFMPYFGAGLFGQNGAGKVQPVYVGDVARAFVDAIENRKTIGQTYDLAGPDVLTWPQLHRAVAKVVAGKPRRLVMPLPAWYAKLLAAVTPQALLPFNRDQVIMSQEDNSAPIGKFVTDFGWIPRPYEPTLASYADQLRTEAR